MPGAVAPFALPLYATAYDVLYVTKICVLTFLPPKLYFAPGP